MNELTSKYFLDVLTSSQKKELLENIRNNAAFKKEFADTQNALALATALSDETGTAQAQAYMQLFKTQLLRKRTRRIVVQVSRVAAIFVIGAFLTWLLMHNPQTGETAWTHLSVPAGQRAMLSLSDGTTVWLNAKSSLSYPENFTDNTREVILKGEAYFDVVTNTKQPFTVHVNNHTVQALGTQFNIFAYDIFFEVSLIEGRVKVYENEHTGKALLLEKNEKCILIANHLHKQQLIDTGAFKWKEGIYSFDDAYFPEIIRKLELYYDVSIEIQNQSLLNRKYTVKFRQRDGIENVLKVLQIVYPFHYQKDEENNKIVIQ